MSSSKLVLGLLLVSDEQKIRLEELGVETVLVLEGLVETVMILEGPLETVLGFVHIGTFKWKKYQSFGGVFLHPLLPIKKEAWKKHRIHSNHESTSMQHSTSCANN